MLFRSNVIACPSCGRCEIDVVRVAESVEKQLNQLAENEPRVRELTVAVMGCVVNGPGEAREADLGIAAGRGRGHLFIKGQVVRVVPEEEMVAALLDEARLLAAEGVEARLAAADETAALEAQETALELRTAQGDANRTEQRRAAVADVAARD